MIMTLKFVKKFMVKILGKFVKIYSKNLKLKGTANENPIRTRLQST